MGKIDPRKTGRSADHPLWTMVARHCILVLLLAVAARWSVELLGGAKPGVRPDEDGTDGK
jgi:hypothetical protein